MSNHAHNTFKPGNTCKSIWKRFKEFFTVKRVSNESDYGIFYLPCASLYFYFAEVFFENDIFAKSCIRICFCTPKTCQFSWAYWSFFARSTAVTESLGIHFFSNRELIKYCRLLILEIIFSTQKKTLCMKLCTLAKDLKMIECICSVELHEVCYNISFRYIIGRNNFLQVKSMRLVQCYGLLTSDLLGPTDTSCKQVWSECLTSKRQNVDGSFFYYFYFVTHLYYCALHLLSHVGTLHKEHHTIGHVVGVWRQKEWLLFPLGSTSS